MFTGVLMYIQVTKFMFTYLCVCMYVRVDISCYTIQNTRCGM